MRFLFEKERVGYLLRLFNKHGEIAYVAFRISGPQATIEFPSDWHEEPRVWVRIGLVFAVFAFSFPWFGKLPKDEGQCSGPQYGFCFFEDLLFIYYGKDKGKRDDPHLALYMPWSWKHREHKILSEPEKHDYRYRLKNGELQIRTATIRKESRMWTRKWIPWKKTSVSINVEFDGEVGEGTGSWKGGTLGCGYNMIDGETPLACLRRMESERVFD